MLAPYADPLVSPAATDIDGTLDLRLVETLRLAQGWLALSVMVSGGSVFAGWMLGIPRLQYLVTGWASMKANTALCLLVSGLALWLVRPGTRSYWQQLGKGLGLAVAGFCTLILLQQLTGLDLGIDQLLVRDSAPAPYTSYPGRVSSNAAISLILGGIAIGQLDRRSASGQSPSEWLAMLAVLPPVLALVGYGFQIIDIAGLIHSNAMAPHTAIAMLLLSAGILAARPTVGGMRWFVSLGSEGTAARRVLPGSIALIVLTCVAASFGWHMGWYDHQARGALFLLGSVAGMFLLLMRTVSWLAELESMRRAALGALSESRQRFAGIFQSAMDAVISIDREQRIVLFNAAAETIFRLPAAEAHGRRIEELLPHYSAAHDAHLRSVFGSRASRRAAALQTLTGLRANGEEFQLEASIACLPGDVQATIILRDISARVAAEEALRASEQRFRDAADAAPAKLWVADPDGRATFFSRRWFEFSGQMPATALGHGWLDVVHPDDRERVEAVLAEAVRQGNSFECEFRARRADGAYRWMIGASRPQRADNDEVVAYVGSLLDITDRRDAQERIRTAALYDPLTGLPNRALVFEYGNRMLAAAARGSRRTSLLFIDLDRFKPINDTYGHEAGDHVLKEVAQRLSACTRKADLVGRLGGDEFVVLLSQAEGRLHECTVAQHILRTVSQPIRMDDISLEVTPSIGIARYPDHGADFDTLLHAADRAMYEAKQGGRAGFHVYSEELDARAEEARAIEKELRHALNHEGLVLHYQPVIRLDDGHLVGAEALVRMVSRAGQLVGPSVFIPVAEASGMIGELGEWVVREACRQQEAWRASNLPSFPISINVSPAQFRNLAFADQLGAVIRESGIDPSFLQLEVTESMVMGNVHEAISILDVLRSLGVKVALDDFGTGYSSLSLLSTLPLDRLKIDQSFVRRMRDDPASLAIVRTIIALGQSLQLELTAEGVESGAELEQLQAAGCTQAQGYFISHPLPAAQFTDWHRKHLH